MVRKVVTGVVRTGDADAGAGADGVRSEADVSEKFRPRSVAAPVWGWSATSRTRTWQMPAERAGETIATERSTSRLRREWL